MTSPVFKMREVLEVFKDLNEQTPVQWMQAFIIVADAHERGEYIRPSELTTQLGVARSSATRIIQALSWKSWTGKPGLDVIVVAPDADDARSRVVTLNPKGQRVWERIKRILNEG